MSITRWVRRLFGKPDVGEAVDYLKKKRQQIKAGKAVGFIANRPKTWEAARPAYAATVREAYGLARADGCSEEDAAAQAVYALCLFIAERS